MIVSCLHEHVIKNTARAYIYDLAEYLEAIKEGIRKRGINYPGNRDNLSRVDEFLKRLKEIALN